MGQPREILTTAVIGASTRYRSAALSRFQRASAAFRAISRRCSGDRAFARAFPPRPPNVWAAVLSTSPFRRGTAQSISEPMLGGKETLTTDHA